MLRIASVLGGAGILVFLLWRLGPLEILDAIRRIGWSFLPVLLLGAGYQAVRALALNVCVERIGMLRYRDALAIRLSGEAIQSLTFTGPMLAEPTKAWLLETHGLTLKEGFAATITEYLIYAFITAAMSITGLLYLIVRFEPPAPIRGIAVAIVCLCTAFLIASAAAIACRFYLIGTVIAALARIGILRGRLSPDMTWINRMEDLLLIVLRDSPVRFVTTGLLEIAAQALLVSELFWLLRALDLILPVTSLFVGCVGGYVFTGVRRHGTSARSRIRTGLPAPGTEPCDCGHRSRDTGGNDETPPRTQSRIGFISPFSSVHRGSAVDELAPTAPLR